MDDGRRESQKGNPVYCRRSPQFRLVRLYRFYAYYGEGKALIEYVFIEARLPVLAKRGRFIVRNNKYYDNSLNCQSHYDYT